MVVSHGKIKEIKVLMNIVLDVRKLHPGHWHRGVGAYIKQLMKAFRSLKAPNFSVRLIKQGEISPETDLVHYPWFDLFWRTLPSGKPQPAVVTIHDLIPLRFPEQFPRGIKGSINFQVQKMRIKNIKMIIVDSLASKKDVVDFLKIPVDKIRVIHLASDTEFHPIKNQRLLVKVKKKYSLPPQFVCYVGDVNYNKNIPGLIKAFSQVKKTNPQVKLVLVGKVFRDQSVPETKAVMGLIRSLGLVKEVLRLGWVAKPDLVCLYNLATVYVQPSFYEGFGLPVLEAMACGTPVVCSRVASLPEIAGQAAVFIDPNRIGDIARGLNEVLRYNNIYYCSRAREGQRQAKKFSWQKTAQETIKVYDEVLKKR